MWSAISGESTRSRILRGLLAWLSLTALLAALRFEVIDLPPYYDSALGLFREADFLAESNFDYLSLTTEQRRFEEGGSAVYIISILPTFVAMLMTYSATPHAMLVSYHLFIFACAALVLVILYTLIRPFAGRFGASLIAAAVATTPLFGAQIDMTGMEIPLAASAMLATLAVVRERFVLAAMASFLTMLIKLSGIVITMALIVYLVTMLIVQRRQMSRACRRKYWLGLSLATFCAAGEFVLSTWVAELPISVHEVRPVDLGFGLSQLAKCRQWCPDVVGLLFLGILGYSLLCGYWMICRFVGNRGTHPGEKERSRFGRFFAENRAAVFSAIVLGGALSSLSLQYTIPRYLVMPVTFLYLALATLLFSVLPWRRVACGLLVVVIGFNLANDHGAFYPNITSDHRSGAILERSREYLADHRSNIKAIRLLESTCPDDTFVAGTPFIVFLSLPRLGYLEKPAHGYAVNIRTTPTFESVTNVLNDKPRHLTFIHVMNAFHQSNMCVLPEMGADDVELYNDRMRSPLIIFRHEIRPAENETEWRDRYATLLWPKDSDPALWPESILIPRCEALASAGQIEQAVTDLQSAYVRRGRRTAGIVLPLARLMHQRGDVGDAEFLYGELLDAAPKEADAHIALGSILHDKGDLKTALKHLAEGARLLPTDAPARWRYGKLLSEVDRPAEALEQLLASLSIDPNHAGAHALAAQILFASGKPNEAEEHFRRAIDLDEDHIAAQSGLGQLLAKSARPEDAVEFLSNALKLQPDLSDVAADLAWIYATHPEAEVRNGTEAVILAQQACTSSEFRNPEHLDILAAAYAEQGDFPTALRHATDAMLLASTAGQIDLSRTIRRHIERYRKGQPFRETVPNPTGGNPAADSDESALSREPLPSE